MWVYEIACIIILLAQSSAMKMENPEPEDDSKEDYDDRTEPVLQPLVLTKIVRQDPETTVPGNRRITQLFGNGDGPSGLSQTSAATDNPGNCTTTDPSNCTKPPKRCSSETDTIILNTTTANPTNTTNTTACTPKPNCEKKHENLTLNINEAVKTMKILDFRHLLNYIVRAMEVHKDKKDVLHHLNETLRNITISVLSAKDPKSFLRTGYSGVGETNANLWLFLMLLAVQF